jgi:hypothetical protein
VPCTKNALVLNWPDGTTSDDLIKEEVWVWLGFVRPGTHSIVVKDSKKRFFTRTVVIETRDDLVDV